MEVLALGAKVARAFLAWAHLLNAILEYLGRVATYGYLVVIIELLLIGLMVYWLISFLEGTRGERLFRGVIIILFVGSLVLKLIVKQFHFERLEFLYTDFLITVLIVAVAAFQPELRRGLIRIGQASFLSKSSHQQLSRTVEEIIGAVTNLSERRIGAIIVIERVVGLGEFVETGVRIDAKVTADLLKTIFYPGTPLHDMAVIIQGDRIIAARAQLPLAEAGSFEGIQLGSRHRAALGITNGSDATVIVVSEETGIISLAEEGQLDRHVDDSKLRKQLTSAIVSMIPVTERFWEKSKRSFFSKNKKTV